MVVDKRKGWMANLKEGDKVILNSGFFGDDVSITTVERITPGGLVVVEGRKFRNGGILAGDNGYSYISIKEFNEEEAQEIKIENRRKRFISILNNTKFGELPYNALHDMVQILIKATDKEK